MISPTIVFLVAYSSLLLNPLPNVKDHQVAQLDINNPIYYIPIPKNTIVDPRWDIVVKPELYLKPQDKCPYKIDPCPFRNAMDLKSWSKPTLLN